MRHGESSGAGVGASEGDRAALERLARASSVRAGLAQRARIVLLAADGVGNAEIAERVGVARHTVLTWRARYRDRGLAGLDDIPEPGKPKQIDPRRIIAETLKPPPKALAVTHWSSRLLGARLKVGNSTIAKAWSPMTGGGSSPVMSIGWAGRPSSSSGS